MHQNGVPTADGAFWMGLAYFNTMRTVVNGITPQISSAGANGVPVYKAPIAAPVSGERTMVSGQDMAGLAWLAIRVGQTDSLGLCTAALHHARPLHVATYPVVWV